VALYTVVAGPAAAPAQRRWLVVLVVGAVALLAASRDPGRPRLARRLRRGRDVPGEVPGRDSKLAV